jgi:pimeloyl-ACP methyl ester carboxylesterase
MYQVKRHASSANIKVRNTQYHYLSWGNVNTEHKPVVMVHGWMDVAASYQFMVDCFSDSFMTNRLIVAPDWRGYGQTPSGGVDNYWFDDYLADLDFFLDAVLPGQDIDLIGHSMGGHVAMMYAGARPERIHRLVNLEGFGGPDSKPVHVPKRRAQWMNDLKTLYKGDLDLRPYASSEAVAARLMKTNPRLAATPQTQARAHWLAKQWAKETADGQWAIQGDAAHKIMGSEITREDEILASYERLSMPVLAVEASDDSLGKWWAGKFTLAHYHQRLKSVPNCRVEVIQDAGHMLHHDQPEQLAQMVEDFLFREV